MRWFVAAVALGTVLLVAAFVTGWGLGPNETTALNDLIFFVFFTILAIGLPGACAIAILRYRLYELDIVVKKTVLYAVVALVLIALFFVFAILVGAAFIEANPLAILGSIAIGLAIWPVVRVARRVADRVVYGGRATPYEVLTEFSDRVGGSYASEDVLPRMARVLADAVGARDAVVWLHVGNELRPSGMVLSDGPPPAPVALRGDDIPRLPADCAVEVRDQGAAPRRPVGVDARERSDQPLEGATGARPGVAGGPGASERRLIEELRASRQRLVAAQDEERRKLERNIHDGAQQQLVALTVKLRLLEQLAERDPAKAAEMAAQLQDETRGALERPAGPRARDLPAAARRRGPAGGAGGAGEEVPGAGVRRRDGASAASPQDVEAAVYFSCLEALQNVAKYAGASTVHDLAREVATGTSRSPSPTTASASIPTAATRGHRAAGDRGPDGRARRSVRASRAAHGDGHDGDRQRARTRV